MASRPLSNARRARVHGLLRESTHAYTRPLRAKIKHVRCNVAAGTQVHNALSENDREREKERERKRYRIVDYLKCIGNKPRRVTRCKTVRRGLATSPRYRATLGGAIRLKSSHLIARAVSPTATAAFTQREVRSSSADGTEDLQLESEEGDAGEATRVLAQPENDCI